MAVLLAQSRTSDGGILCLDLDNLAHVEVHEFGDHAHETVTAHFRDGRSLRIEDEDAVQLLKGLATRRPVAS